MRFTKNLTRRALLAAIAFVATAQRLTQGMAMTPTPDLRHLLSTATSWGYQLQNLNLGQLRRSPVDVLVIDYSRNGEASGQFSKREIETLKRLSGGGRRIVLAYLSIGEAEDYRFYWQQAWTKETAPAAVSAEPADNSLEPTRPRRELTVIAPSWLKAESADWAGNYGVDFTDPGWQDIVFRGPKSYLARIQMAGFDGVYLDRVDAFYDSEATRTEARQEMVAFVRDLAEVARAAMPGFLIVPQNAEELLLNPDYLALIDGIAKEDLLYGHPDDGKPNPVPQILNSVGWLGPAKAAAKPVFTIEYVADPALSVTLREDLQARGYIPTIAARALNSPPQPPPKTKHPIPRASVR